MRLFPLFRHFRLLHKYHTPEHIPHWEAPHSFVTDLRTALLNAVTNGWFADRLIN